MKSTAIRSVVTIVLALSGPIAAVAQDRIVNIGGQQALCNGCTWGPLAVRFGPGSYLATPVTAGSHPGAQYTAYNFGMGLGWSSAYSIALDRDHIVGYGSNGPGPGSGWPDEATAFAHSAVGAFTLSQAQDVYFGVADSIYGDNFGGVSLRVAPVPEPAGMALMLAGLGVLGIASRRLARGRARSGDTTG